MSKLGQLVTVSFYDP